MVVSFQSKRRLCSRFSWISTKLCIINSCLKIRQSSKSTIWVFWGIWVRRHLPKKKGSLRQVLAQCYHYPQVSHQNHKESHSAVTEISWFSFLLHFCVCSTLKTITENAFQQLRGDNTKIEDGSYSHTRKSSTTYTNITVRRWNLEKY